MEINLVYKATLKQGTQEEGGSCFSLGCLKLDTPFSGNLGVPCKCSQDAELGDLETPLASSLLVPKNQMC